MIDKHTLVVAYDDVRGEPRGKLDRKHEHDGERGDCVDCGLCVDVCPTGIDIRKGTQLECINCTACIDVCNDVMEKIHKEHNLIGFFSENMIHKKEKPSFTPRMMGYTAVISILIGVLCFFIFNRSEMDLTVMRSGGLLYQEQPGGFISNLYNAEVINKTNKNKEIIIKPEDPVIKLKYIQAPTKMGIGADMKMVFFINVPAAKIHTGQMKVRLQLISDNKVIQTVKASFVGPIND
jgi:cytochrome c oxidase accessory protein FixG